MEVPESFPLLLLAFVLVLCGNKMFQFILLSLRVLLFGAARNIRIVTARCSSHYRSFLSHLPDVFGSAASLGSTGASCCSGASPLLGFSIGLVNPCQPGFHLVFTFSPKFLIALG